MTRNRLARYFFGTASMLAFALPAAAQQASPQSETEGDVVVVTAQKREQDVTEVPQSIDVVSDEQLERQQINQLMDLQRVAPSLELGNAPGQSPGGGGQIRGIGTQSFNTGAVGSVGVVVDQVSQGNLNITDLFDIARVEVLKGPQGTLFGLTTSAGVINIVTNAPDPSGFDARLRTELAGEGTLGSKFGQQVVQGMVNVPLAENAAVRFSSFVNQRQGIGRNTVTDEFDSHVDYGVRGRVRWEPTDRLTFDAIGEFTKQDSHDGPDFIHFFKVLPAFQTGVLTPCNVTAGEGNRDYCQSTNLPSSNAETTGFSGQVDYDFGPTQLTYIAARREQETGPNIGSIYRIQTSPTQILNGATTNARAAGLVVGDGIGDTTQTTHELRIANPSGGFIEYTGGLFVSDLKGNGDPSAFCLDTPAPTPCQVPPSGPGFYGTTENSSFAAFGQATINVNDALSFILGARYTEEELSFLRRAAVGPASRLSDAEFDNTSWRVGARYEFTADLNMYASASKGYKGPQIAQAPVDQPAVPDRIILPEIPSNYEVGLKYTFGNGMLLDANAFLINVENYQGQSCSIGPPPALVLSCVPVNVDGVESKGFELNLVGNPLDNLTFTTGLLYNKAEYPDGYLGNDGVTNMGGEQLQGAPEWKFNLSGEYTQPFGEVEGFVAAEATWRSEVRHSQLIDENVMFDAHWLLGGRIGVRSEDGRWTAAIFGRNLLDEHVPVFRLSGYNGAGNYGQILSTQSFRLVGVSLDYSF